VTEDVRDACPSENSLLERAVGKLVGPRALAIDAHVDTCETCRAALAGAARNSSERSGAFPDLATFSPGEKIDGRYVTVRRIGVGGMGEVYEVHDDYLDEVIALKTLTPAIADNSSAIARLRAEVRLARRVTHENVCRIYDLGFHQRGKEQVAFLTMELIRGVTLRQRIVRDGPLPPAVAQPLIEQMARGLGHAHASGIVHRDFKSDNVMLVPATDRGPERAVVMDFGLARAAFVAESQALTPDSHTVLGTLDYMSPEQVKGLPATVASDVYALGIVMYEMMTGRLPFEGESPLARALLRVTDKAPTLRSVLPNADAKYEACIARCLMADTRDRFEGMDAILRVLGAAEPARASQPRWVWAATAFATSVVAAVVGYSVASSRRPAAPSVVEPVSVAAVRSATEVQVPPSEPTAAPAVSASAAVAERHVLPVATKKSKVVASVASSAVVGTTPSGILPSAVSAPVVPRPAVPAAPSGNALLDPFGSHRAAIVPSGSTPH
jgi:serine/threonine protein kinase